MQREHCNIRTPLLKVQDSIYQLLNNMTLQDMLGGTPLDYDSVADSTRS